MPNNNDKNSFNTLLNQHQCEFVLKEKLKSSDFQLLDYSIKPFSDKRLGYLGEHLRLKCTILKNNSTAEVIENFFIKLKAQTDSDNGLANFAETCDVYRCERDFYQLVKIYQTLNQTTKWCPNFYSCFNNKTFILEDLSDNGYRLPDQFPFFDIKHCQIGLKALASFHAFSFKVIQESAESKKTLRELYPSIANVDMFAKNVGGMRKWFDVGLNILLFMFTLLPAPKRPINELQKMLKRQIEIFYDDMQPADKNFYVINHGDLHSENMLFKYDVNNMPIECCLIDFQTTRCGPCSLDVYQFLFLSTTIELQNEHRNLLTNFYYDQLARDVKLATGKSLNEIYNRTEFEKNCRNCFLSCKIMAASYKSVGLIKNFSQYLILEDFAFGDRIKYLKTLLKENEDNYRDRMISVMEDLQNCLLDAEL